MGRVSAIVLWQRKRGCDPEQMQADVVQEKTAKRMCVDYSISLALQIKDLGFCVVPKRWGEDGTRNIQKRVCNFVQAGLRGEYSLPPTGSDFPPSTFGILL